MINQIKIFIKRKILRKIISKKLFWKFRHFFQKNYFKTKKLKSEQLTEFIRINEIKSVLDFGCSSGDDLFNLKLQFNDLYCFGIEINKNAISYCNKNFKSTFDGRFLFLNELNEKKYMEIISFNKNKKIDLVVFNRVLYILSDKELNLILQILILNPPKFILINDFYSSNQNDYDYKHRDYESILKVFNYRKYIENETSQVLHCIAKEIIFKQ